MFARRVYPELNRRGFAQIIIVAVIALVLGAVAVIAYQKYTISHQPWTKDEVPLSSPSTSNLDQTANWKTYTNAKYNYTLKYPNEWSTKEEESAVVLSPPKETNPTIAIAVSIINYKLTPPLPVNYTYQTQRKVVTSYGDILVQVKQPGSEQYMAQITSGDLTAVFTFGRGLDRKYDAVFDQILSTFKFTN